MGKLAKVLPIPKDNYDPNETYFSLDWVRYEKKVWVCKIDGTKGIEPEEGDNWMLLLIDGIDGGGAIINDDSVTTNETWSSRKIQKEIIDKPIDSDSVLNKDSIKPIQNKPVATEFERLANLINAKTDIDDNVESTNSTWSSQKIKDSIPEVDKILTTESDNPIANSAVTEALNAKTDINDNVESTNSTWSSRKIKASIPEVDKILTITSDNPIANSAVAEALNDKADLDVATKNSNGLMSFEDKRFIELLKETLYGVTLVTPTLSGNTLTLTSLDVKYTGE